ncbi:MAG: hypothetical protein QOE60_878 [Thermoleophilaceae bacterium]|jgi:hypothetical protein|nr:hypothetical protein [Thermoleophilaceae bacterium]
MQNYALKLWNDLRARRLVPVAALLLAGLVAAPIVLSKKADESPAPAPAPAQSQSNAAKPQGPKELAQVKLDDALGKGNGSSLSAFDVNDPFAPPKTVIKKAQDAAQGDAGTPTDTGQPTDTGTGTGDTGTGGDTGGGDTGGGGQSQTGEFTYVLDVTFWANGKRRQIKGMEKLDMLPNQAAPLLIFMGVSDGAGNAVFLVDSTLETAGEGKCKPSHSDCAFLYLGAGSEQEFTNEDGDSYRMRIDEIRKVKVGSQSSDGSGTTASDAKSSKSASAAVDAPVSARRFSFPLLTDVIVESAAGTDNSTGADERR